MLCTLNLHNTYSIKINIYSTSTDEDLSIGKLNFCKNSQFAVQPENCMQLCNIKYPVCMCRWVGVVRLRSMFFKVFIGV